MRSVKISSLILHDLSLCFYTEDEEIVWKLPTGLINLKANVRNIRRYLAIEQEFDCQTTAIIR